MYLQTKKLCNFDMEQAILNEINKKYTEAAECYEIEIVRNTSNSPDIFINLAFLYWCFAFELFECNIPNEISEYWSNKGGHDFLKVLDLGIDIYPTNLELHFWKRYFTHIIYGETFTKNDCLHLIEKYGKPGELVAYFFLYQFDNITYQKQRDELIHSIELIPTAKNLYIKSLLV